MIVKNKAPVFTPSVPSSAYEDEEKTISVPSGNLIESDHDKNTEGLLTYIFDFGDGNSITTNTTSSVTHKWTNAGKYPVTITVIDDQGALSQETEYITINNKDPTAAFTVGGEIPATWSFSNDIPKRMPFGWSEATEASRDVIKVIKGKDSHARVLEITGNYPHPEPGIKKSIGEQYYGSVEYYFQTSNASEEWGYLSLFSGNTEAISVFPNNSKWYYRAGGTPQIISNCEDPKINTWIHIRIDYLVNPSYLPDEDYYGLNSEKTFRVIIDGIQSSITSFSASGANSINQLRVGSHTKSKQGTAYIDSIGSTSDPSYTVGQNYNYYSSEYYGTYDWRNEQIGDDPAEWEIDAIDAKTSGSYAGSYTFDTGWSENWTDGSNSMCDVRVISNLWGHDEVLEFYDNNGNGEATAYTGFDGKTSGTIEFWANNPDQYKNFHIKLYEQGVGKAIEILFRYRVSNGPGPRIYYFDGSGEHNTGFAYVPGKWHHFRVDWDCSGGWNLWIDDTKILTDKTFITTPGEIDRLLFETGTVHWGGFYSYVDAVGIEGVYDYNIGDNKYSPLDVSIVDAGGDYKKVVKFADKDTTESLAMYQDFDMTQSQGTIQFHMKTANVEEKAWAISLLDGTEPELLITISDNNWTYTTGGATYHNMTALGTPQADQWYPVTIEFNEEAGKFYVKVNGSTSGPHNLGEEFDKVSKIKFESTESATGTTLIDALSYSFDPLYQKDDYLTSLISYPEKTSVHFSAADSTDSASDKNSLRYYWKIEDTEEHIVTAFGEQFTYDFKTSGKYNISLAVKDDNGAIDYVSHIVLIHNKDPNIDIIAETDTIIINEGDTLLLNSIDADDITDWAELIHYWDYNSTQFSLGESNYEQGGWRNSHLYTDDFMGTAGVKVIDPEGASATAFTSVFVQNVNPLISIWDATVISNISFEVYRNSISKEANYTFELYANEAKRLTNSLTFDGSSELSESSTTTQVDMTLCKDWKVVVNSTQLPSSSWFRYYIRLQFLDGQELVISSNKIYGDGSNYGYWERILNPYFYDNSEYSFKFPVNLKAHIWDPSVDDIHLILNYQVSMLLEISCTNSLPLDSSFTFAQTLGITKYNVHVFEQDDKIFANISAVQNVIYSEYYYENNFPVDLDAEFTIYPIIDLVNILEDEMELQNLIILHCHQAENKIIASVSDDDNGFPDPFNYIVAYFDNIETAAEYYYGSPDSFNKEAVGTKDEAIAFVDHSQEKKGWTEIVEEIGGHKNVLQMTSPTQPYDWIQHDFPSGNEQDGIREFWIRVDNTDKRANWQIRDGGSIYVCNLRFDHGTGKLQYKDHNYAWQDIQDMAVDTWYHIRIDWEWNDGLNNDILDIYVDGSLKVDDVRTQDEMTDGADRFIMYTHQNQIAYLDAWGNPAQSDYSLTNNMNPYDIEPFLDEGIQVGGALSGSYLKITDSVDGHTDVLEMYDNQNNIDYGRYLYTTIPFGDDPVYGTIECWMRTTDATLHQNVAPKHGGTAAFQLRINDDKFQYLDDTGWNDVSGAPIPQDNSWYHIRIAFDCEGVKGYEGLGADEWKIWIDGVEYGAYSFDNAQDHLDKIYFGTNPAHNGYAFYIDEVELSQFNYNDNGKIDYGSNLLEITFNTEDNIEFINLSPRLDALIADNASTTREVKFYLQISDFDQASDLGEYYTSNFKDMDIPYQPSDFYVIDGTLETDYGNLIYCDNDTSTLASIDNSFVMPQPIDFEGIETKAAYYYGTASFNKEKVGTSGTDIGWVTTALIPNDCSLEIVGEFDNHKNVLEITHDGGASGPSLSHWLSAEVDGTYEFWWGSEDTTDEVKISFISNEIRNCVILKIVNDTYYYIDSNSVDQELIGDFPTDGVLDHHKIVLNHTTHTFDWYVNGMLRVDDGSFKSTVASNVFIFKLQYISNVAGSTYLDAWGSAAQSDYSKTYNINPYDIEPLLDESYRLKCAFGDSHIKITSSVDGHEDVLEMYDNQNDIDYGDILETRFDFPSQEYGTIGCYIRSSEATLVNKIRLFHAGTRLIYFAIFQDKFQYYDGTWQEIPGAPTPQDDTWYNISIAFESTAGGYKGLAQYDWKVWINGIEYGDFDFENNYTPDNLRFSTGDNANGYTFYIDDVDFSSRYTTIYDGTLEKIGNLKNIDGDYTTFKSSQLVDSTGNYKSTWFVEDDQINTMPDGWWSLYQYDGYTSCYIVDEVDGHKKVLRCKDYAYDYSYRCNTNFNGQTSGVIEFYWRRTGDPHDQMVSFWDSSDGSSGIGLQYMNNYFHWADGTWRSTGVGFSENTWYHHKLVFDCNNGTKGQFDWYINGILKKNDANFQNDVDSLGFVEMRGMSTQSYNAYFDALSITGLSDNYQEGDNKEYIDHVSAKLNLTLEIPFEGSGLEEVTLHHSWKTNISDQYVDLRIWNYNTSQYDLFSTEQYNSFSEHYVALNSSYFNNDKIVKLNIYVNNSESNFKLYLDKLKINTGNNRLDFYTKFTLDIEGGKMIKFLRLFYAYSVDIEQQLVNISLYNALEDEWVNINSVNVGTETYQNRYTVLSNEFIINSNQFYLWIEAFNSSTNFKLFFDQLKIDYFCAIVSKDNYFEHEIVPYDISAKEIELIGDLRDQDDEYTTIVAVEDGDYPAEYSFEKDVIGGNPNGWTVYETGGTVNILGELDGHKQIVEIHDTSGENFAELYHSLSQTSGSVEWFWRTNDATDTTRVILSNTGSSVVALAIVNDKFRYSDGTWKDVGKSASDDVWYHVRVDFECTGNEYQGLSQYTWHIFINDTHYGDYNFINYKASIDKIEFDTSTSESNYYHYIDAIDYSWAESYYEGRNKDELDIMIVESFLYLEGVYVGDEIVTIELLYSFATNISQTIEIYLYNYTSQSFVNIQNKTLTEFSSENYSIVDSDYYSDYLDIKVKFIAENTSDFEFYLDKCILKYSWHKSGEDQVYEKIVEQSDFSLLSGNCTDWTGTFGINDDTYATYQSLGSNITMTMQVDLEALHEGDRLDDLELLYSYKTNQSNIILLYIYNYTDGSWFAADNQSHLEFFNGTFSIPISRDEAINENETQEVHDFYNSDFVIKIKMEILNTSGSFEIYLNLLKIAFNFTHCYFLSNISRDITELSEYVSFDAYETYGGTYSFEKDADNSEPDGWTVYEDWSDDIEVISEVDGHKKVLKIRDPSASQLVHAYNIFKDPQIYGNVSFWWRNSHETKPFSVRLYSGASGSYAVYIAMIDGYFKYGNDLDLVSTGYSYSYLTWYYHEIEFDCADKTYNWYVDGEKIVADGAFYNNDNSSVDRIRLISDIAHYSYTNYFDGFKYSWDIDSKLYNNKEETTVVDETFDLELEEMNPHRLGLFDTCKIEYTLNTSINGQEISVYAYNFENSTWIELDSFNTSSTSFYNGSCVFEDNGFISDDYWIKIKFRGTNDSIESFTLNIDELTADYNWSYVHTFFGYNDLDQHANYYSDLSSQYLYWYYSNTSFNYEGKFLITMTADDGYSTAKTGDVIEIIHPNPYGQIMPFPNETYEDQIIDFESKVYGSGIFVNETRFFWDFGDGYYGYDSEVSHAWATSGNYTIRLIAQDCFGNTFMDNATITVKEKPVEIIGPYTFYGVEAQAITLAMETYDSNLDELSLEYRWYNSTTRTSNFLFSTDKKPSVILDDGEYEYAVEIEDENNAIANANLSIFVENVAPQVFVSSYGYYGAPGEDAHGTPGIGRLNLTAYVYDCFYDIGDINFEWVVYNGTENITETAPHQDTYSMIYYKCMDTRIYTGVVKVTDASGGIGTATFAIDSFIDSDSDGLSDEFEYQLELCNQTESMYDDDDNDGLINKFELGITNTSTTDPDTDNDGLYDGVNNETGLGELTLGTDPRNNDTDNDGLSDSFEYYGWTILTEAYGNITVSSNPCYSDTDNDGLDDYEEYITNTDPHNPDTDKDGLQDGEDPHPTKWDGDGDGLNDKIEVDIGTDPNNTDTDEDGLSDGEEVIGWGFQTDPLDADSDNDFLSDSAELKTYKFEHEKKAELDKPISLWFKEHAVQPASAQLAFTMSFGEYAKNDSLNIEYGVQNATNLEIVITKAEQDLIVFNTTTNGTEDRYISHVIDLKSFIENLNDTDIDIEADSFDYFGKYIVRINDTQAECLLEQFEIEVAKWLDPNNNDTDGDGIMDGVETGALVRGIDIIDFKDIYWYEERNYAEPQGWWKLDDESKGFGVAEDWSGNENDGDLTNMWYENWVPGKIGPYALFFDGTNEYVNFDAILEGSSTGAFGDNSQQFTITAWINATDLSNAAQSNHGTKNCFIAKAGSVTNDNFEIGVNNDGKIHVYLDTESHDTSANLGTADDVLEGNWTFITVRYYYGNLTLSIDNKTYESTAWQGGSTDLDAAIGANFTIGRTMDSSVYFEGSIDDVRVYNTRLNDNNIEWIYYNGSAQSLNPVSSGAQLTTGNGSDTYDEFQLEIPYIGEVFDADLTLKIESEETPWGNSSAIGTIEVELIKDELNCSVEDAILIDTSHYIYDGWDFSKQHNLELSEYLANGSISEYYGTYILRIEVTDTNFSQNYNFTLSEFYIETDTWIQADGLENYKAWVTDPAKWDTDGDGWSDPYEIFQKGTNPYSVDTDADGIWDPKDIDPFKDILIEIKFISGRHRNIYWWQGDPEMEGLVEFELMGMEMFFVTELKKATCDPNKALLWNPNQKCYFGHKYYINPPDDHKYLDFRFELWQISPTAEDGSRMGDLRLVKADYDYNLNYEGYTKYKEFESEGAFGHANELEVRIKTLSMERANTIAIYEANSTFVGHYQEQEKMNVIQLWVTDDGTGTPFQKGPNAIVISTSLFGNTKLHSMLEKEQLQQTPLWSPIKGDYQFIAVDRDKNSNSDGASNNVDFVIIRRAISSAQAMDVLDLLMTCYVNESIDEATNLTVYEEAKLYTYASTKINGIKAVKMNLHVDVLGYVPYFSDYKNSEQGQEPNNKTKFTATFILVVAGIIAAIVVCAVLAVYSGGGTALVMIGLICMLIYMLDAYLPGIAEILTMIKAFMIELVMTVLTWLGPLGWLILRAVILAMIWAMFAITLIVINIIFNSIYGVFNALIYFYDLNIELSSQKIEITGDVNMTYEYFTTMRYSKSLNFDIPAIETYFNSGKIQFEFKFSLDLDFIGFSKFPQDIINSTMEDWLTFLSSMGSAMGLCGGGFTLLANVANTINSDYGVKFGIATYLWILVLILSIFKIMLDLKNPDLVKYAYIGLGIGCIIAAIAAAFPELFIDLGVTTYFLATGIYSTNQAMRFFDVLDATLRLLEIIDLTLLEDLFEDLEELEIIYLFGKCGFSLLGGTVSLITGSYGLSKIPYIIVRIGLAVLTLCIGVFFLAIGCAYL